MDLILVPGNSGANKEWTEEVESVLKSYFDSSRILYYEHWKNGEELINMERELNNLVNLTRGLDKYVIFAKSAGVILTLRAIFEKKISPIKCIFVGTALNWGRKLGYEVDTWLTAYSLPTLFIQQSKDPITSFTDLQTQLIKLDVQNHQLIKIPGDTHHYANVEELRKLVLKFIGN